MSPKDAAAPPQIYARDAEIRVPRITSGRVRNTSIAEPSRRIQACLNFGERLGDPWGGVKGIRAGSSALSCVRVTAIQALAKMGGPESISLLKQLLADDSEEVREAAVNNLTKLVGPEARDILVTAVQPDVAPRIRALTLQNRLQ